MLPDIVRSGGIGKVVQTRFGGVDLRPDAEDWTLRDTENMTPEQWPRLASRKKRYSSEGDYGIDGMLVIGDVVLTVQLGGLIYYNDWELCYTVQSPELTRLARFGNNAIIIRTREIINLTWPLLGAKATVGDLPASPAEGDAWVIYATGRIYRRENGVWVDKAPVKESLEKSVTVTSPLICGDTYQGEEAEMNTIWDTLQTAHFDRAFKAGDAVRISGCTTQPENNQTLIVREVTADKLRFYENSFRARDIGRYTVPPEGLPKQNQGTDIVYANNGAAPRGGYMIGFILTSDLTAGQYLTIESEAGVSYLHAYDTDGTMLWHQSIDEATAPYGTRALAFEAVKCTEPEGYMEYGDVTISKAWPEGLVNVFEDSNRLWGWHGRTIYASKLGDPSNWYFYDGLSEDSWSWEIQRPGDITGGISLHGYPTFYTEDRRYMIYGTAPSSFQVSELDCFGVRSGCADSMAIVDGALYYVGRNGIMRDTGAVPECCSEALGPLRIKDACAGGVGYEYWICGVDEGIEDTYTMIYDVRHGIWIRDGEHDFVAFGTQKDRLLAIEPAGSPLDVGKMVVLRGDPPWNGFTEEDTVLWRVCTNVFTQGEPNRKRVHRIQIRAEMDDSAEMTVRIRYDSTGSWINVWTVDGSGRRESFYLPVLVHRCDHFMLMIEGTGDVIIHSVALETRKGSPMH